MTLTHCGDDDRSWSGETIALAVEADRFGLGFGVETFTGRCNGYTYQNESGKRSLWHCVWHCVTIALWWSPIALGEFTGEVTP